MFKGTFLGSIDGLEDFIVSQNLLPLGSLIFLCFCVHKAGWGWDKFIEEADAGEGLKFPKGKVIKFYLKWIAPVIVVLVFVAGYLEKFKINLPFYKILFITAGVILAGVLVGFIIKLIKNKVSK